MDREFTFQVTIKASGDLKQTQLHQLAENMADALEYSLDMGGLIPDEEVYTKEIIVGGDTVSPPTVRFIVED